MLKGCYHLVIKIIIIYIIIIDMPQDNCIAFTPFFKLLKAQVVIFSCD